MIQMLRYEPLDVTIAARKIAKDSQEKRRWEHQDNPGPSGVRFLDSDSIDPLNQYGKKSVYATEVYRIHFGKTTIDLTDVEQIVEISQTKAITQAIDYLGKMNSGMVSCAFSSV